MKHQKHYRVAKREAEVKNVTRTIRKEKKTILIALIAIFSIVWLEGFIIGNILGKKASTKITCV